MNVLKQIFISVNSKNQLFCGIIVRNKKRKSDI